LKAGRQPLVGIAHEGAAGGAKNSEVEGVERRVDRPEDPVVMAIRNVPPSSTPRAVLDAASRRVANSPMAATPGMRRRAMRGWYASQGRR
jgi:hypothetical protein